MIENNLDSNQESQTILEKTKKYLPIPDFIHKTLASISILIPFVFLSIGATFQINFLNKIGVEYIRFFSISQLLSDSIVIMISFFKTGFLSMVLGLLFTLGALNLILKRNDPSYVRKLSNLVIISSILLLLLEKIFDNNIINSSNKTIDILIVFNLFLIIEYALSIRFKTKEFNLNNRKKVRIFKNVIIVLTFLLLSRFVFLGGLSLSIKALLPIRNFVNYEVIHKKYEAKGFTDSLLYFNDQYIFIQVKKDSALIKQDKVAKIEILKFEELFKNPTIISP